jgi:tetratricopeptide (TPR) repeat protein
MLQSKSAMNGLACRQLCRVALIALSGLSGWAQTGEPALRRAGPERVEDLLGKAKNLWEQGRCAEATPLFEEVTHLAPDLPEAYFALGACYGQAHETANAARALRRYVALAPKAADGWAALGLVLTELREFGEARRCFEQTLRIDPAMPEGRKGLARVLLVKREDKAALPYLEALLAAPAPDEEVYVLAATAHFRLGARDKAVELCERGLVLNPGSGRLEQLHAQLLLACGHMQTCRDKLAAAQERNPQSPAYLKALAELLLNRYPLAEGTREMVERVLEASPDDPAVRYLGAHWALANRHYPEAIKEAEQILAQRSIDPGLRAHCLAVAGLAYKGGGHEESAEAALRKAHAINRTLALPNSRIAMYFADVLWGDARVAEAFTVVREALAWNPEFGPLRFLYAKLLGAQGQREKAAQEAEGALRLGLEDDNQERSAHGFLAQTYYRLGRERDAQAHRDWIAQHRPAGQER